MASKPFVLTAEVVIRGGSAKAVAQSIEKQLQGINAKIGIKIDRSANSGLDTLNKKLILVNQTLVQVASNSTTAARAIGSLASSINGISSNVGNTAKNLGAIATQSQRVAKNARDAGFSIERLGYNSALSFQRFASFAIATKAILALKDALFASVKDAVSFQREVVRLSQVTGGSISSVSGLEKEITRLSTSLGVPSKELIKVATTLTQAGISAKNTTIALQALAEAALAPNFGSLEDTTEASIAAMAQFNIEAKDLRSTLGSINAVSAAFAVEAEDITTAITKAGGAFKTAGGDLNEFLALFTSVRATTRESADTIAVGLRTIFTRLQRRDTIDALRQLGIELLDVEGKFVGPYEAIQRLGNVIGKLPQGDVRIFQIGEQLAGYRQIPKFLPLIQQLTLQQRALDVAQAGGTSTADDARRAQEALATQFQRTKEEFDSLIRSILNDTAIKTLIKTVLELTRGLIGLAKAFEPIIPVLGLFAAAKIGSNLKGFGSGIAKFATGRPLGLATGGFVPGSGSGDTVPAMLTPGEYVINKKAAQRIGYANLNKLNGRKKGYNRGGIVQYFAAGGTVDEIKNQIDAYAQKIFGTSLNKLGSGVEKFNSPNPKSRGYYDPNNKNVAVRFGAPNKTLVHELTHRIDDILKQSLKLKGKFASHDLSTDLGKFINSLTGDAIKKAKEYSKGYSQQDIDQFVLYRTQPHEILAQAVVGELGKRNAKESRRLVNELLQSAGLGGNPPSRGGRFVQPQGPYGPNPLPNPYSAFGQYVKQPTGVQFTPPFTGQYSAFNSGGAPDPFSAFRGVSPKQYGSLNAARQFYAPVLPPDYDPLGIVSVDNFANQRKRNRNLGDAFGRTSRDFNRTYGRRQPRQGINIFNGGNNLVSGIKTFSGQVSNNAFGLGGAALGLGTYLSGNERDRITAGNEKAKTGFITGSTIAGAGAGLAASATIAPFFGPGAPVVLALGAAVGAIYSFRESVKEADRLSAEGKLGRSLESLDSELGKVFNNRNENTSRASASNINRIVENLSRNRSEFLASGGDAALYNTTLKKTSQELLIFLDKLSETTDSLGEFRDAAGDNIINYLSKNSGVSREKIFSDIDDSIKRRKNIAAALDQQKRAEAAELRERSVIISLTAAMADAADKANSLGNSFDATADILSGGFGSFQTRGNAGIGALSRPGQISNLAQFQAGTAQAGSLIGGPVGTKLQNEANAVAKLVRELPVALEELKNEEGIPSPATFLRTRFAGLNPAILERVIAGLDKDITGEKAETTGLPRGIDNPQKLAEQIIQETNLTQSTEILADFFEKYTTQLNSFGSRLKSVLDNEISIREGGISVLKNEFDQEKIFTDLRNEEIGIGAFDINKNKRVAALSGGLTTPSAILASLSNVNLQRVAAEQKAQQTLLPADVEAFVKLTQQADILTRAFQLAADSSERVALIQEKLGRERQRSEQLNAGVAAFAFGGDQDRLNLNRGAGLALFAQKAGLGAIAGPDRGLLKSFLDQFSDVRSNIFGQGPNGEALTGKDLAKSLTARELRSALGLDAQTAATVAGQLTSSKEDQLITELQTSFDNENKARLDFLQSQQTNNTSLITGIQTSFDTFLAEFRKNVANSPVPVTKANGGSIFRARGTDTVPAMLTPGEYVINANSTKKHKKLLDAINKNTLYKVDGGIIDSNEIQRRLENIKKARESKSTIPSINGIPIKAKESKEQIRYDHRTKTLYKIGADGEAREYKKVTPKDAGTYESDTFGQHKISIRNTPYGQRSVFDGGGPSGGVVFDNKNTGFDYIKYKNNSSRNAFRTPASTNNLTSLKSGSSNDIQTNFPSIPNLDDTAVDNNPSNTPVDTNSNDSQIPSNQLPNISNNVKYNKRGINAVNVASAQRALARKNRLGNTRGAQYQTVYEIANGINTNLEDVRRRISDTVPSISERGINGINNAKSKVGVGSGRSQTSDGSNTIPTFRLPKFRPGNQNAVAIQPKPPIDKEKAVAAARERNKQIFARRQTNPAIAHKLGRITFDRLNRSLNRGKPQVAGDNFNFKGDFSIDATQLPLVPFDNTPNPFDEIAKLPDQPLPKPRAPYKGQGIYNTYTDKGELNPFYDSPDELIVRKSYSNINAILKKYTPEIKPTQKKSTTPSQSYSKIYRTDNSLKPYAGTIGEKNKSTTNGAPKSKYFYTPFGMIPRFASGGMVDNIPAYLSAGEYVINRKAVQTVGKPFLDRVNAKGYALGGPVKSDGSPGTGGSSGGRFSDGTSTESRAAMEGLSKSMSQFVAVANSLAKAMTAFPQKLEITGRHTVEVIHNGTEVFSQITPMVEQLVITKTNEALAKFQANKLPGINSY